MLLKKGGLMAADIAVVSFDRFLHGNEADRQRVATEVYNAFSTVGWVYIKYNGISQSRVDDIFALVSNDMRGLMFQLLIDQLQAKDFFSLPLDQKLEYRLIDAELNQGYTAEGVVRIRRSSHTFAKY